MIAKLGSGHIGGTLSICEALAVLYNLQMKYDSREPQWEGRDYLVLSKGHGGPALYATLALKGFFALEELSTLNRVGTILPSHCDRNKTPGVDMSAGSLGQGVSCALGIASGLKIKNMNNHVFAILGDGETQEGQVWETLLLAPNLGVTNFTVLLDNNKQQADGFTCNINSLGDIHKKVEDFGWNVISCEGHDIESINDAINACKASNKPGFVVMNTRKAKGWNLYEGKLGNHSIKGLTMQNIENVIAELQRELED
jgi:transketolase